MVYEGSEGTSDGSEESTESKALAHLDRVSTTNVRSL
jgi:hypothetical protein